MKGLFKRNGRYLLVGLVLVISAAVVDAGGPVPNTFTSGEVISAAKMNQNFQNLADRSWDLSGTSLYYNAGNVGIGTTTPGQKLTVAGTIESTSGGVKFPDGTTQTTAAGASSQWTTGAGGVISYSGGNVGIGTTTPNGRLHIESNLDTTAGNGVTICNTVAGDVNCSHFHFGQDKDVYIRSGSGSGKVILQDTGGNVGIGTTTPGAKLEVAGQVKITGGSPGANKVLTSDAAGLATWQTPSGSSQWTTNVNDIYYNTGNVGIGTTSPTATGYGAGSTSLDIVSSNTAADLNVRLTTGTGPGIKIRAWSDGVNFDPITTNETFHFGRDVALSKLVVQSGNVGIGTTSPAEKLSVAGIIQSTSGGFKFPDGTTQTTAAAGGGIGGSGTANYIPKFTGSTALGNSVIYETSVNVGIGTTSPGHKLQVAGNIHAYNPSGADAAIYASSSGGNTTVQLGSSGVSYLNGGNVGIGITNPSYKLDVAGSANASSLCIAGDCKTAWSSVSSQWTTGTGGVISYSGGNVGIGTTSPSTKLTVQAPGNYGIIHTDGGATPIEIGTWVGNSGITAGFLGTKSNHPLSFFTNNSGPLMTITTGGKVGIGTTSPAAPLHVVGSGVNDAAIKAESNAAWQTGFEIENTSTGGKLWQFVTGGSGNTQLFPGNFGVYQGDWRLVILHTSGTVGIGTKNPNDGKVEVKGGTVCVDTNSDDFASTCIASESDVRLKKNIRPIESALEKIQKIRGVLFDWRWDEHDQIAKFKAKPQGMGVIAQEVEKVFPEALNEDIGE